MKINGNEIFRVAAMTLRHRGAYFKEFKEYKEYEGSEDAAFREAGEAAAYDAANETAERFFQSAMLLPEHNFLGWQINAGKNGAHRMFAFFGSGDQVTWNDLDWIFGSYAALEPAPRQFLGEPWGESRRIYALQYAPYDCRGYQGSSFWGVRDWGDETEMKCEFFASLGEAGASLRITASGTAGTLLLSLPDPMTLRMRAMLSLAFPNTVAVELDNIDDLEDKLDPYPTEYLSSGMIGLLTGTMLTHLKQEGSVREQAMKHEREIPPSPERDMDELTDDIPEEIEDMDFSVRTYNCLRRAGIRTVGQLTELTDEDLHNIRNLGRKSIEEIHRNLARWGYSLKRSDLTVTLDELIGLQNVKEQVRKITALARMRQDMEALGKDTLPLVLNMEFVGNPGTAKTTVARILAGIFYEIGLLPSSHLVEVGRADLVAQHVGHTAEKVRDVFRRAKGKVLFIDEAYSLMDDRSGSFGDEAINTIVQEMENNRKDTVVIFAGYPDEMEDFFSRNPGLRSRVPFQISFSDYSADEMVQITELEAAKRGFSIRQSAREKLEGICAAAAQHPDMGNGRFCRNLAESAILGYASRVYGGDAANVCGYADEYADADVCKDFELAAEDFALPEIMQDVKKTVRIGFGA